MKKIYALLICVLSVLLLAACSQVDLSNLTLPSGLIPSGETGYQTYPHRPTVENEIDEIDLVDTGSYTITFWHIWGQQKSAVLESMCDEFEQYMKDKFNIDVTVESTSQSNYNTLLEKTNI